ncbi:MAG TPA: efflux RND transporter periplasmic adaptor subunit [Thermoanaerobaculia bacterium]|nr:efflux RND transporter periplasmic adaptor subunit [Thermoanaerobaculia bacterium]
MTTRSATRALVLLSILGALYACGGPAEHEARHEVARVAVRLGAAERVELAARTSIAGTVTARRSTAVSSRVTALVTSVPVELGQQVAAGQVLIAIDPTAAQGQVSTAQGALAQAEAGLALAQRNHERFLALAARQAASELEVDQARAQHEQALGAVEQARGALAAARSVASESSVRAPFAGRVTEKLIEMGDLATPGRPLVRLESTAGGRLTVSVAERVARESALALGQQLAVTIDARPDLGELDGEVVEVSGPDPRTHSYTVAIDLGGVAVPAGAAARAFLPGTPRQAVVVPRDAIVEAGGLLLVVVRGEAGEAQTRVVTLGAPRDGDRVEVLSGLGGGETVALGLAAAPPAGAILEEATS